ncbi:MAG: HepT-like ribonuclease domain-containing protein [Euryarchaeota archaeon]|nr:HepT-like ribonuclease domain-containing protein [Euryarchaeota archaeon]
MAGFRNLLMHRYGDVDNTVVLEMIQSELSDVVEVERAVVRFVDEG